MRKLYPEEARSFNIWQTTPWVHHLICSGKHAVTDLILTEDRTGVLCPTCHRAQDVDKIPPVCLALSYRPLYPLGQAKWAPEDLDVPLDYVPPSGQLAPGC